MLRTRIKICGITRKSDADAAVVAGADALGLVFYPPSPRAVSVAAAADITSGLPPLLTLVGLFVNAEAIDVERACNALPLSVLQFHGNESESYCRSFGMPYMKALRIAHDTDVAAEMARFPSAHALLLDTWQADVAGGSGKVFNWEKVPRDAPQAVVLAGGLSADNVGRAIAALSPYAVDVSSGVESAPGVKDSGRIEQFVVAVRTADTCRRE